MLLMISMTLLNTCLSNIIVTGDLNITILSDTSNTLTLIC